MAANDSARPKHESANAQEQRCSRRNAGGDHLAAAINSSGDTAIHGRGDVVCGGFLQPPSNGFSNDRWALITALTPRIASGSQCSDQREFTSH